MHGLNEINQETRYDGWTNSRTVYSYTASFSETANRSQGESGGGEMWGRRFGPGTPSNPCGNDNLKHSETLSFVKRTVLSPRCNVEAAEQREEYVCCKP